MMFSCSTLLWQNCGCDVLTMFFSKHGVCSDIQTVDLIQLCYQQCHWLVQPTLSTLNSHVYIQLLLVSVKGESTQGPRTIMLLKSFVWTKFIPWKVATWWLRRTWRERRTIVKNEGRVLNKQSGNPRARLRAVALPVNKVLPTPTPLSGVHDLENSKGLMPINDSGGRRGLWKRAQLAGQDWFDLRHMKRGMDPEKRWKM